MEYDPPQCSQAFKGYLVVCSPLHDVIEHLMFRNFVICTAAKMEMQDYFDRIRSTLSEID